MPLVPIAHFVDLPEAQVAAAALRASGIPATVQNEVVGQNFYYLQRAFGGFRLWVPEADAADARAFVAADRAGLPEEGAEAEEPAVRTRSRTALGMLLAVILG